MNNPMFNPYQGLINPQYQPQIYQPPQPRSNRIWVQGEAGAKSYLVAPNSIVDLWDSESQTIYVKQADNGGMPTMQIIDYTVRGGNPQNETPKEEPQVFVKIEDFNALKEEFNDLRELLKPQKRSTKTADKEEDK